jgi:hypothetical protein
LAVDFDAGTGLAFVAGLAAALGAALAAGLDVGFTAGFADATGFFGF